MLALEMPGKPVLTPFPVRKRQELRLKRVRYLVAGPVGLTWPRPSSSALGLNSSQCIICDALGGVCSGRQCWMHFFEQLDDHLVQWQHCHWDRRRHGSHLRLRQCHEQELGDRWWHRVWCGALGYERFSDFPGSRERGPLCQCAGVRGSTWRDWQHGLRHVVQ